MGFPGCLHIPIRTSGHARSRCIFSRCRTPLTSWEGARRARRSGGCPLPCHHPGTGGGASRAGTPWRGAEGLPPPPPESGVRRREVDQPCFLWKPHLQEKGGPGRHNAGGVGARGAARRGVGMCFAPSLQGPPLRSPTKHAVRYSQPNPPASFRKLLARTRGDDGLLLLHHPKSFFPTPSGFWLSLIYLIFFQIQPATPSPHTAFCCWFHGQCAHAAFFSLWLLSSTLLRFPLGTQGDTQCHSHTKPTPVPLWHSSAVAPGPHDAGPGLGPSCR